MSHVWIGLGSNLGDRSALLSRAVAQMTEAGVQPLRTSHLYETAPEHGLDEPPYLNAVIQAESERDPRDLLRLLQSIETDLGRVPPGHPGRGGSRAIDLDLLSAGAIVETSDELVLPHPRLAERIFVLVPLCEIDPQWRHPVTGESAGSLLSKLPSRPGEVRLFGPLEIPCTVQGYEYPWRHSSAARRGG